MGKYNIERISTSICIGWGGENNWRPQTFDCSTLLKTRPNGTVTLWILPNGESEAFPVALTADGNLRTWTPLDSELVGGGGKLQFHCQSGTDIGKSPVYRYMVEDSILTGAEHPDETPSWAVQVVEEVTEQADRAEEAASRIDPESIEQTVAEAVEGYMDEHPVQAPVTSVNGKTGVVVLDASNVGALPDDTVIPASVTEETVAGWGFTKNTGTYSKPAGGIPASDLATGVIPSVPQMATQADMSDWTAGKTVDAATLKTNFTGAMTLLGEKASQTQVDTLASVLDDVQTAVSDKANISDIPTAVSQLTNDSGYQNAQQVQGAIAPLQTKAITDTGNYYTTDTVEGALQEIGAELAGVNTLIGSGVIT